MIARLFLHWITLVIGLYLVSLIKPLGIVADTNKDFLWAALVLLLVNTFIRPILVVLSFPLVILTLGFFLLVLNGIILYTLPDFVTGFHVPSFTAAFFGSLVLSIITSFFGFLEKEEQKEDPTNKVIDI